jgi:hypothetical protein
MQFTKCLFHMQLISTLKLAVIQTSRELLETIHKLKGFRGAVYLHHQGDDGGSSKVL